MSIQSNSTRPRVAPAHAATLLLVAIFLSYADQSAAGAPVSALNSPASVYIDGEFRIAADAVGPNGAEILIATNASMTNARSFNVPYGVVALRLAPSVQPNDPFFWTVAPIGAAPVPVPGVTAAPSTTPPTTLALLTPKPKSVVLFRAIDAQSKTLFRWSRIPNATSYVVQIREKVDAALPVKLEITGYRADPRTVVAGREELHEPYVYAKIDPPKSYEWSVEAYRGAELLASSGKAEFATEGSAFDQLHTAGFWLQRSFTLEESEKAQKQPATFGVVQQSGTARSFNTEFALGWKRGATFAPPHFAFTPGASIEARLNSNGTNKNTDAVRLRITEDIDYNDGLGHASWSALSLKYETSRAKSSEKLVGEVIYTPTLGNIGRFVGSSPPMPDYTGVIPADQISPLAFRWRPFVGMDVGNNLRVGTSKEEKGTVFRLFGRVKLEVAFDGLANLLGLRNVNLFCDDTFFYLPLEDQAKRHNYLTSGIDFYLTSQVALSLRYSVGADAPTFVHARTFSTNIGVQF